MNWMIRTSIMLVLVLCASTALAYDDVFVTEKSEVYLYGNAALAKPYVLILDGETVTLNDVAVFPTMHSDASTAPTDTTPESPKQAVYEAAWQIQSDLIAQGLVIGDVTLELATGFQNQVGFVELVTGITESSFWVYWVSEPQPEEILVTCHTPKPTREQLAHEVFDLYRSVLERDCLVVISSNGNAYVPPNDSVRIQAIRNEIAYAQSLPSVDRASFGQLWRGGAKRFLAPSIAWQFTHPLPLTAAREE